MVTIDYKIQRKQKNPSPTVSPRSWIALLIGKKNEVTHNIPQKAKNMRTPDNSARSTELKVSLAESAE